VLVPLTLIALSIVFQLFVYPGKIPNIFGYKVFMVFDEYMDETVKFGDLVGCGKIYHSVPNNVPI